MIIAVLLLFATTAPADDIIVTVSGPYMNTNKVITTKETALGGIFDDRFDGCDHYGITALLDGDRVVVTERYYSYTQGLGNDTTSKYFIPTNMLPYTFTLSNTTVTVSQVKKHSER